VSENQSALATPPNDVNVDGEKAQRRVSISRPRRARGSTCLAASELLIAAKSALLPRSQPDSRTRKIQWISTFRRRRPQNVEELPQLLSPSRASVDCWHPRRNHRNG